MTAFQDVLPQHSIGVVEALEHSGCQHEIFDHFFPGRDQRVVYTSMI